MSSEDFKKLVKNTIVLSDDKKAYYISKSDSYAPDTRTEMSVIIHEEEANLQQDLKKEALQKEEKQQKTHERLQQLKQIEQAQIIADEEIAENLIKEI